MGFPGMLSHTQGITSRPGNVRGTRRPGACVFAWCSLILDYVLWHMSPLMQSRPLLLKVLKEVVRPASKKGFKAASMYFDSWRTDGIDFSG